MRQRLMAALTVLFALVLGLAVLTACGDSGSSGGSGDISLSVESCELDVGETKLIVATSKDGGKVTWTTSDDSIVHIVTQVASRGIVTVQAMKDGNATLTATNEAGKSATCAVKVEKYTVSIAEGTKDVTGGTVTVLRNGTTLAYEGKTLQATIYRAGEATDETAVWSSSDEAVVTVENGVLTAHDIGTAVITAKRSKGVAEATVTVEVKWDTAPTGWYKILHGGETNALGANVGKWTWTGDEGWGGSTPTLSGDGFADGGAEFSFSGNTGWRWYGMQLFYKNSSNLDGHVYKVTFTLTSDADGMITVNDFEFDLQKGKNTIEAYRLEGKDNASVYINMAVHDKIRNNMKPRRTADSTDASENFDPYRVEEANMKIEDLKFEEVKPTQLLAPTSFALNDVTVDGKAEKEIAVTDPNPTKSFEGYVVGFFEGDAEDPSYTQVVMKPWDETTDILETMKVKDGKMLLDTSYVKGGTYTVKVRSYTDDPRYSDSGWSSGVSCTVEEHAISYEPAPSYRALDRGIGKLYYWSEWNMISNAKFENGTLSFRLGQESDWYSDQFYYTTNELVDKHLYELTFKFKGVIETVDASGNTVETVRDLSGKQIVVNSQRVDLGNGEQTVTVRFFYEKNDQVLGIQLGKPNDDWSATVKGAGLDSGKYYFSDIQFKDLSDPEANAPMYYGELLADTATVTDELAYWYAASGKLTYVEEFGDWMANGATMHSMSSTPNSASDTGYSYTFDYTVDPIEGRFCNWIVRFFYKKSGLVTNGDYKLTLVLNSSASGDVMINGTTLTLQEGEHEYHIFYKERAGMSLWMNMATDYSMILDETLTIKSLKWEEGTRTPLTAPTGSVTDGVVTFTNPNTVGVDHAEIGLFSGDRLVSTQKITNNEKIDDSVHMNGSYTVKLRLCGTDEYADTDWVTIGNYTVTGGFNIGQGTMSDAVSNAGEWYVWLDTPEQEGSAAMLNKAEIDRAAKKLTVGYTTSGTPRLGYSVQLFYEDPNAVTGKTYTLSLKVKLSVSGIITINDKQITFVAGQEQDVEIVYTEKGRGDEDWNAGASISIQMGVYQATPIMAAEITLSGWSITELTSNPNGDEYYLTETELGEGQIPADSTFYYWSEWDMITNATFNKGTVSFHYGTQGNWYSDQIFYNSLAFPKEGTYSFSVKVHTTVAGMVRINGKPVTLEVGDNTVTVETCNGMFSMQMGLPVNKTAEGDYDYSDNRSSSTLANADITLSEFRWTAADGTVYGLDGRIS